MKNLLFALAAVLLLATGCNTAPEETLTTELSYFTPYQNYPEYLNGQIKSLEEMNYLPGEENGVTVKGELLGKTMRDSLRWSANFNVIFDETGNTLQVDRYYDEGDTRVWKLEWDDKKMMSAKFIRLDTVRYYWKDIEYDEMGYMTKARYYRADPEELITRGEYSVDDRGNWEFVQTYDAEGTKGRSYRYDFNENDLNTSLKIYNGNDSLLADSKVEYNDKGLYTKAEYLNGLGELRRVNELEYTKYDEMGNWLEVKVYDDGKLILIAERIYEYY